MTIDLHPARVNVQSYNTNHYTHHHIITSPGHSYTSNYHIVSSETKLQEDSWQSHIEPCTQTEPKLSPAPLIRPRHHSTHHTHSGLCAIISVPHPKTQFFGSISMQSSCSACVHADLRSISIATSTDHLHETSVVRKRTSMLPAPTSSPNRRLAHWTSCFPERLTSTCRQQTVVYGTETSYRYTVWIR